MKSHVRAVLCFSAIAVFGFTLSACSSASIEEPTNTTVSVTDLHQTQQENGATVNEHTVTSQGDTENEQGSYEVHIQLTGDLLDGVVGDGTVHFSLWGYDKFVADVMATSILETSLPIKPIADSYQLNFSASDLATTEYQSGAEDGLGYYITFFVDVNNDGIQCTGDYRQDYELSEQEFYRQSDFKVTRTIAVTNVTSSNCGHQ